MFSRLPGDTSLTYTQHSSIKQLVRMAFEKINQAAVDSVIQVTSSLSKVAATDPSSEFDGIRAAENFLWKKIQGLGGSSTAQGVYQPSADGSGYIQKRIHEMLLGIALITEAYEIATLEKQYTNMAHLTKKEIKEKKDDLLSQAVFKSGPEGVDPDSWAHAKREACGSFAVFACFGVAGWFSVFTNRRRYHSADVYSIMTLADQRFKAFRLNDPDEETVIDSTHPLTTGAWKYMNSYILELIDSCGFKESQPDWDEMQDKWIEALNPTKIAELILLDVYSEISQPNPCISRGGQFALSVKLEANQEDSRHWVLKKLREALPGVVARDSDAYAAPPPAPPHGTQPPGGDGDSDDESVEEATEDLMKQLTCNQEPSRSRLIDDEAEEDDD